MDTPPTIEDQQAKIVASINAENLILEEKRREVQDLNDEIEQLTERNEELSGQVDTISDEQAQAREDADIELQEVKVELNETLRAIKEAKIELDELILEGEKYKKANEQAAINDQLFHDQRSQRFANEIAKLQDEQASIFQVNASLKDDSKSLTAELNTLEVEKSVKVHEIEDLDKELVEVNLKLKEQNSKIQDAIVELKSICDSQLGAKAVLDESNATVASLEAEAKELEVGIASKQEEYDALKGSISDFVERKNDLDTKEAFIRRKFEEAGFKF